MCDQRLIIETRRRLASHDYEAIFAHGGCFHFALKIHERFGYPVRGIREGHDGINLSHVWCLKEAGHGVDIRGIYPEDLLAKLANAGKPATVYDIQIDEIRNIIASKGYPAEIEIEIFRKADFVLDNHERFQMVKPSNPAEYNQFLKNIDSG
jgi:hypothetical protein